VEKGGIEIFLRALKKADENNERTILEIVSPLKKNNFNAKFKGFLGFGEHFRR